MVGQVWFREKVFFLVINRQKHKEERGRETVWGMLYGPKYRLYFRGQLLVGEVMATNMTDVKSRDGAFWLPSLKILNI
jgi:hypothetical protein